MITTLARGAGAAHCRGHGTGDLDGAGAGWP